MLKMLLSLERRLMFFAQGRWSVVAVHRMVEMGEWMSAVVAFEC